MYRRDAIAVMGGPALSLAPDELPFCRQKYGCSPVVTYSTSINPKGDKRYVNWNVNHGGRDWTPVPWRRSDDHDEDGTHLAVRRLPPARLGPGSGTGARGRAAGRDRLAGGDGAGPRPVRRAAGDVRPLRRLDHGQPRLLVPLAARPQECAARDGAGVPTRRGTPPAGVLAGLEGAGLRQRRRPDHPLGR